MKSWLLDADVQLVHSHDEGNTKIYTVYLIFTDLYGRPRKHFASLSSSVGITLQTMVSFTAMSGIKVRAGVIKSISDTVMNVMFSDCDMIVHVASGNGFRSGDLVRIIERFDVASGEGKLVDFAIPYVLPFAEETLCLQSVNADVLDESGKIIYRLSADPLFVGASHGSCMAT